MNAKISKKRLVNNDERLALLWRRVEQGPVILRGALR